MDDFLSFTPVPAVASPCINICRMTGNVCEGCGRTLGEIAEWSAATDTRRQQILDRVARDTAA
ncbi:MAG: DUF1289 domain-containing protein [Alphaproteobacteria bacterium HGW-Alphaproteobacteria-16]|nr:MAG: DUF1289 domain-containing protein [Alphaproteobacteria bacterium HGW-Alphaproteobacteria-16]